MRRGCCWRWRVRPCAQCGPVAPGTAVGRLLDEQEGGRDARISKGGGNPVDSEPERDTAGVASEEEVRRGRPVQMPGEARTCHHRDSRPGLHGGLLQGSGSGDKGWGDGTGWRVSVLLRDQTCGRREEGPASGVDTCFSQTQQPFL